MKKEQQMRNEEPTKSTWHNLAFLCACDAFENNFPSRRGAYFIEDKGVLCIYNNNPYANPTLREEETAKLRQRMKAEGLEELAYATYPFEGHEDAGYTYAMTIAAGEDR